MTDHRRASTPSIPSATRIVVVAALALALPGGAARGQVPAGTQAPPAEACPDGRITRIFVDNRSIFDVDQMGGGQTLQGFYRLANALHVKTREGFIRDELLFAEGDCLEPYLLEESGRILRGYTFIARADVFAVGQEDGTTHVVVDTQDEWTTRLDLGVSVDDGLDLEVLELSEENLGGVGIQVAAFLRQRRERRDVGGRIRLPRLFGSRTDALFSAGRTRAGDFIVQGLTYPFVGEVGRFAVRQTWQRRDEIFPFATSDRDAPYSHLLVPMADERLELSLARRIGEPGSLTLVGVGLSRETLDFPGLPGGLEIAKENDFGNSTPAPPGSEALVADQIHASATTRINLFVGQRNIRFERVRGLDALGGEQDVRLGWDLGLTLGRSLGLFDSSDALSADDLRARLRFFAGHDPGTSFFFFSGGVEGRQVFSRGANGDGWRDVIAEADVYGYARSRRLPRHTLFARMSAAGGWSMDSPFQLTLGGRTGVRGLAEEEFPGGRRLLFSVEERYDLGWPLPEVFDLGLTLFADAGRVWAGSVPFGTTSGWRGAVGGGIRFGFPAGTRGVVRMDLAFPLGVGERGPVFRVTLLELLGLSGGFEDPDLARSRRSSVGPDRFTSDRP